MSNNNSEDKPLTDFFSGFLENYDIVASGLSDNPGDFKKFFAYFYHGLFGIKDEKTNEYVARHTCWHKNPGSLIRSFISWKAKSSIDNNNFGKFNVNNTPSKSWQRGFSGSFTKSLYCITFKLIPWLHPVMFVFRYLWIFLSLVLKFLQLIFVSIGNTMVRFPEWVFLIHYVGWAFASLARLDGDMEGKFGIIKYKTSVTTTENYEPQIGDIFLRIIGVSTPWFLIFSEQNEQGKYGKGEFFFMILALMLVSGILIFFGGATISAVIFAFGYYCFKLLGELSNFKLDPEMAPNPSSTTTPTPPKSTPTPKA